MSDTLYMGLDNATKRPPLYATLSKPKADGTQNTYYCVREVTSKGQGRKIPALADTLPSVATVQDIDGNVLCEVTLVPGTTGTGNAKVSGSTTLDLNGEKKRATVLISVPRPGQWYVKASVNGVGGGSERPLSNIDDFA